MSYIVFREDMMTPTKRFYSMLGNESLWNVATQCEELLSRAGIAHAVCGGVAVCLHGYARNTYGVDFIIGSSDRTQAKALLEANKYSWDDQWEAFRSPSGISVQFLTAGELVAKDSVVFIPEPNGELNVEQRDGLTVVTLSRLIEMKLARGIKNLRWTHKEFADVIELIDIRRLNSSFVRFLHPSLRGTFRQLVHVAQLPG